MSSLVRVTVARSAKTGADVIVAAAFKGEAPVVDGLPKGIANAIGRAVKTKRFTGKKGEQREAIAAGGRPVVVFGLGSREHFSWRALRSLILGLRAQARSHGRSRVMLVVPSHALLSGATGALGLVRHLALARYEFNEFREAPTRTSLRQVALLPGPDEEDVYRETVSLANALAEAAAWARDLGNTPPNQATPEWMAEQARSLAEEAGFTVEVLNEGDLEERGMGGILSVGAGSRNPPRLVKLEAGSGERVVALVGKGITFDTGGISIKPAAAMQDMKFDKSGACAVLGMMRAVAKIEPDCTVRAYLALAENMPDGAAYRPGDIVRCYNGKTVEIHNTDAEGRMVLADALALASEEGADALLEFSTLTGACVVALGENTAGLYTSSDELAADLLTSSTETGEQLWRMPLWPEFREAMKGTYGDLKNSGSRWGGANTAAGFLSNFVSGVEQWAHLDIAGPAYVGAGNRGDQGATGYGVALVAHWLLRQQGRI